jgi:hypothetical protein
VSASSGPSGSKKYMHSDAQLIILCRAWKRTDGTEQTTDFSLATRYRPQAVLEGCRLSFIRRYRVETVPGLRAISQTKTLPFLEYWYCSVALSEIRNYADGSGIPPLLSDSYWKKWYENLRTRTQVFRKSGGTCTDILCPSSARPPTPSALVR